MFICNARERARASVRHKDNAFDGFGFMFDKLEIRSGNYGSFCKNFSGSLVSTTTARFRDTSER